MNIVLKIVDNKYFRVSLVIIIYFLMMELIGNYIAIFLRNSFNLSEFQFFLVNYTNPLSILRLPYNQLLNFLNTLLQLTIYIVLFILLCLVLYKDLKRDEIDYKQRNNDLKKEFLPSLLIYFGTTIIVNFIVIILTKAFNISNESLNQSNIESLVSSSPMNKILMACSVCFLGPIVEELIFRKSMFTIFYNKWVSLVLSSIIFGLMHTLSFNYEPLRLLVVSLPYIASGFVFGIIYIKTDNIIMPILIHALLNAVSLIMM